jgi:hypothetical protein
VEHKRRAVGKLFRGEDITLLRYCIASPHRAILCSRRKKEIDVNHGIVDVFAFQEALLMEAVFGLALLAMIWVGFRRWLQYKGKMGRLIAEQTAQRAAENRAQMERVEARLKAVEQIASGAGVQTAAQIDAIGTNSLPTRS